jgi:RPA family protein
MGKIKSIGMKSEDDWMVEDAMRTLMRAKEIRNDKKLMAKVSAMAKEKLMELADVAAEAKESE